MVPACLPAARRCCCARARARGRRAAIHPRSLLSSSDLPGEEIATHTINHVANPNATQIIGARDWLVKARARV